MMCFGVGFFIFLSLGIHWALWICGFEIFIRFGKFLPMVFSNLFLDPIFFRDSNYICISVLEVVLWLSNGLCAYFWGGGSFFSRCFILDGFYCSIFKFTHLSFP